MAKLKAIANPAILPEPSLQRVLMFVKDESGGGYAQAFGVVELEIYTDVLLKHGTLIGKSEPDVWPVFLNNLTKKARELLGL